MKRPLMLAVFGCAALMARATHESAPPRVALALEQTRFKSALVNEMEKLLERDGVEVTVVNHADGELDTIDPAAFNAVFITNSGVNSRVRPQVVSWIEAQEPYTSRILLHTTQTRDWTVETTVDAVTSASATREVATLAREYVEKLRAILASTATGGGEGEGDTDEDEDADAPADPDEE